MKNINLYVDSIEEIEDINFESFRRIVIFSPYDLELYQFDEKITYISLDKMDEILQDYIDLSTITKKVDLPYLFIFNVPVNNKEFLQRSNWVCIH